jgi:hypothetical protein
LQFGFQINLVVVDSRLKHLEEDSVPCVQPTTLAGRETTMPIAEMLQMQR